MRLFTFLAGIAVGTWLAKRSGGMDGMGAMGRMGTSGGMQRQAPRATGGRDPQALAGGSAEQGVGGSESELPPGSVLGRTDDEVRDRITSRMQRTLRNPGAIRVEVKDGCVTLRGQVQARDVMLFIAEVESTAGVTALRNELEVQGSLDEIAPPMTRDRLAVRAGEAATSRVS